MSKRAKSLAILACAVLMFSCPTYSQNTVQEDKVENKSDNLSRKRPKRKGDPSERPDVPKTKAVEGDQDVLYRPPAVVEFLGIPFGMDIGKFSGVDNHRGEYLIPESRKASLHPLLALVTRYGSNGGGFGCTVFHDSHKKIIRALGGRNDFTASELRQFIDKVREQYPELEENKDKSTNVRLRGTTKAGVSVTFSRFESPVVRESDGELIYSYRLLIAYEAPIKAEEDRQARIKRKIAESDF